MCHLYTYYINESVPTHIMRPISHVEDLKIKDETKTYEAIKQFQFYFQRFKHFQ